MASRGQSIPIHYRAINSTTGRPQAGDATNHTLRLVKDGGTPAALTNLPTEVAGGSGDYQVILTSAETTANSVYVVGTSSTAGVDLYFADHDTELLPTTAPGTTTGLSIGSQITSVSNQIVTLATADALSIVATIANDARNAANSAATNTQTIGPVLAGVGSLLQSVSDNINDITGVLAHLPAHDAGTPGGLPIIGSRGFVETNVKLWDDTSVDFVIFDVNLIRINGRGQATDSDGHLVVSPTGLATSDAITAVAGQVAGVTSTLTGVTTSLANIATAIGGIAAGGLTTDQASQLAAVYARTASTPVKVVSAVGPNDVLQLWQGDSYQGANAIAFGVEGYSGEDLTGGTCTLALVLLTDDVEGGTPTQQINGTLTTVGSTVTAKFELTSAATAALPTTSRAPNNYRFQAVVRTATGHPRTLAAGVASVWRRGVVPA